MGTPDRRPGAFPADVEWLRERYRVERDRRLQPESIRPPLEITGELARYLDDPYTTPVERPPYRDDVMVAVVGGGFAGLILSARLRQAGIDDFRIIDKAGDFGGTWYWNRYPGAQCDTESYIYLPLLEATGYIPNEKYAGGAEILEHCRRIAQTFGLYENACLSTQVTGLTWQPTASRGSSRPIEATRSGPARRPRHRRAAQAEAAEHPRRRDLRGPLVPHQPVGLRLHRRQHQRQPP